MAAVTREGSGAWASFRNCTSEKTTDRIQPHAGIVSSNTGSTPDGYALPIPEENADKAVDAEGFGGCTNHGECTAVCPKGVFIARIAVMRRKNLTGVFGGSKSFRLLLVIDLRRDRPVLDAA